MNPEELKAKIEELTAKADALTSEAEAGTRSSEEVKSVINDEILPVIEELKKEREEKLRDEEVKALRGTVTDLQGAVKLLRKGPDLGNVPEAEGPEGKAFDHDYTEGGRSFFADVAHANKGIDSARQALISGFADMAGVELREDGKAMTEGTDAQGGYLVRPTIERQIVTAKEQDNVLRGLCSKINVTTNSVQWDQLGISTQAGWVAELAQKPELTGLSTATITADVFTAAGLVTVSNQLLADSNPSVDGLATADLTKRLVALEETAFIQGTGVNQPLGILNTPGIGATPVTDSTIDALLAAILDAVADIETEHGSPNAILMHPRTWTRILKENTDGVYLIAPESGVQDPRTAARGPRKTLWGYNVVTSNRVPTNLGAGGNESRVIIGDYSEALILDRQGITVDSSGHVYFTTNATVFRAEERVGFTAGRNPKAFNVIGGAGLANG